MISLRDYQKEAVHKLKNITNELIQLQGSKTIVFKAPTGSGKTIMMAEFLKELVENRIDTKTFAFIWTAPRQLHHQSKSKIEKYYFDSKALQCSYFEDLLDNQIGSNEVLFLNWESINKADNIYIRDNERDLNLSSVIENTLDADCIIILVIDESHFAAKTETSLELIDMIQPKVTIEVSATPNIQGDEIVTVYRERVIDEGMIKKRISVNPDFRNTISAQSPTEIRVESSASESTNEFVLRCALEKRQELAEVLKAAGSKVNPLLLIQLPDRRQSGVDIQSELEQILGNKHSITVANRKLAIYLSEDKANLENITRNDGEVEVMIFKQAIALGWDCPRAAILALFRDWRSFTFSIQTLGRILRMPELKHYSNEELNTGFVYTSLSDFAIQGDLAGDYLTIQHAKRRESYQPIKLRSVYSKRFREETRLSPQFIRSFLQAADELELEHKITTEIEHIGAELITNGIIRDADHTFEHIDAESIERVQTPLEIQAALDSFVQDSLTPFAPEQRSVGRAKEAFYRFLQYRFPMQFGYGDTRSQMVVLAPQNRQYFLDTLNRSKEIYRESVGSGKRQLITVDEWEIPTSLNYNHRFSLKDKAFSILQPFYEANDASGPEKAFADFLDGISKDVEWWFKNGEQDGTFFAVPYTDDGDEKPFYVDWIVRFKDGRIGLFDTKAGITAQTAKARAEGLARYIRIENEKGKDLFGGIVIHKDGSWRCNDNEEYEYNEDDLSNWKFLS